MTMIVASLAAFLAGGAISVIVFWAMQRLRHPPGTPDNKEFASSVAFRLGAIHALVLSLVFSVTTSEYLETKENLDVEAVTIDSIASRYVRTGDKEGQVLVKAYIDAVLSEGLADASPRASADVLARLYTKASADLIDAKPRAAEILDELEKVHVVRGQRILDIRQHVPAGFWMVGILGFFATLYAMTVYTPNIFRLEMVFIYGAMVALLLYLIYEMSQPYSGFHRLEAVELQEVARWLKDGP